MKAPNYITQITRSDLEEIAAATNLVVGPGIDITKQDGSVKIEVNQSQLRRWMRAFHENGGTSCAISNIDQVSLDLSS